MDCRHQPVRDSVQIDFRLTVRTFHADMKEPPAVVRAVPHLFLLSAWHYPGELVPFVRLGGQNFKNPWVSFLLRRFRSSLVLIGLVLVTFAMLRLIPGDPAINIAGITGTTEQINAIRHDLLLDLPLQDQFTIYITNLSHFDLGRSFFTREPVAKLISQRVGTSMQLASVALLVVLLLSIPLGMIAGAFTREGRHKKAEVGFTAVTSVLGSLPEFLTATFLAFIFAVWLRLFRSPASHGSAALVLPDRRR